jgi:flagellar protein FliL
MPMKRVAIFFVLFLVLGGGGVAGWWFMLGRATGERDEAAQHQEQGPQPIFVDLDPVTVPVIRDGQVIQHMTFVVVLQVGTEAERGLVTKSMRRLTDAYIKELHVLLARRFAWEDGDIVPLVRKRLMAASERVMGPEAVEEVLVKGIQSRKPQPA